MSEFIPYYSVIKCSPSAFFVPSREHATGYGEQVIPTQAGGNAMTPRIYILTDADLAALQWFCLHWRLQQVGIGDLHFPWLLNGRSAL